jgi:SP family xylose:H+ symportor-like MFS transporter
MKQNQEGSRAYLISIVMVAVLGGLLFGYDTAVISGAEKGLQAFFMGAKDFTYTNGWHGFTCASALIGCVIGSSISGILASRWGRKKSLVFAGILFFISALGSMDPEFLFFTYGVPTYHLLIMFNLYRVIGGVGVGLASAICPMYIGRNFSIEYPGHAGFLEPVCNYLRSIGSLFCQFHYSGEQCQPRHQYDKRRESDHES